MTAPDAWGERAHRARSGQVVRAVVAVGLGSRQPGTARGAQLRACARPCTRPACVWAAAESGVCMRDRTQLPLPTPIPVRRSLSSRRSWPRRSRSTLPLSPWLQASPPSSGRRPLRTTRRSAGVDRSLSTKPAVCGGRLDPPLTAPFGRGGAVRRHGSFAWNSIAEVALMPFRRSGSDVHPIALRRTRGPRPERQRAAERFSPPIHAPRRRSMLPQTRWRNPSSAWLPVLRGERQSALCPPVQLANQRARRLEPKCSFSATRAADGALKVPVRVGPDRKSMSTRPTRP
jgi:hypothetical protein